MPTPKQVRYHYAKIYRLHRALSKALNDAHDAKVIDYDQDKFGELAPCKTHWQTDTRIHETTKKALANAMREEIQGGERSKLRRKD